MNVNYCLKKVEESGGLWYINSYSGVNSMFMGEYQHSVDAKGRLIIPAKFREQLGPAFILTCGLDNCLYGYSLEEWRKLEQKLKDLPMTKKDVRAFVRLFFSGATEVEVDKQGRINIPTNLLQFAQIQKDCTIVGVSNKIELWSSAAWTTYFELSADSFNDIAENLIGFDF